MVERLPDPKFKVGDPVIVRRSLHGQSAMVPGTVTEVHIEDMALNGRPERAVHYLVDFDSPDDAAVVWWAEILVFRGLPMRRYRRGTP